MIPHASRAARLAPPLLLAVLAACADRESGPALPDAAAAVAACAPARTLALQPGDTAVLTAAQAACFALGERGSYLLAGYDTRAAEASRTGPEPSWLPEVTYTLAERTGAPAASSARGPAASLSAAPAAPRPDATTAGAGEAWSADEPFARELPWRRDDRFRVTRNLTGAAATARVLDVYGGRYVVAVVEGDEHREAAAFREQLHAALGRFLADGVPLFRSVFGADAEPATSAGSGQVLILLSAWDPALSAGNAATRLGSGGEPFTRIDLNLNVSQAYDEGFLPHEHAAARLKLLSHELAHAWAARYLARTFGPGAPPATVWAAEGTADLLGIEMARRFAGVGRDANLEWDTYTARVFPLTLEPRFGNGVLVGGYLSASSFLRDQQARLVRAGVGEEEALRAVVLGALEGMHGRPGDPRAPGLSRRLSGLLGRAWRPDEGVLLWALAQAADDRTPFAHLQNPLFRDVSNPEARFGRGWSPAVERTITSGSGETHRFTWPFGSVFHARMQETGGGVFSALSDVEGSRWMVVRVR